MKGVVGGARQVPLEGSAYTGRADLNKWPIIREARIVYHGGKHNYLIPRGYFILYNN